MEKFSKILHSPSVFVVAKPTRSTSIWRRLHRAPLDYDLGSKERRVLVLVKICSKKFFVVTDNFLKIRSRVFCLVRNLFARLSVAH